MEQKLMITDAELIAAGVPAGRIASVRAALEKAVAAQPQLNDCITLAALARKMKRYVDRDWQFSFHKPE